ncbi:MAG: hypothetical protein AB1422_04255 [bacterium]
MDLEQFFEVNKRVNLTWFYPKICKFQDQKEEDSVFFQFLETDKPKAPFLLYIHIPFCESFCAYCACFKENVYKYSREERVQFVNAMIKELQKYASTP